MERIRELEDLDVWQRGRDLVLKIYKVTHNFPKEEVYGISFQLKRSPLSVPTNIAEGFRQFYFMDKGKFYSNARGSLHKLRSNLLISKDLGLTKDKAADNILQNINELSVKLNNLINKTRILKGGVSRIPLGLFKSL